MRYLAALLTFFVAAAALGQTNTLTDQEKSDGWALLFDGKSLDGWTTSGDLAAWTVEPDKEGGVVTMAHPGHGEWLRTTRMYRDYELLVDFDVAKGMNSGVGLRGSSVGDPAFTGMEIQVFGNQGEKPTITSCGSVYDAIAPTAMPLKDGGQWNTFRIRLVGDTLNIWLNGEQVHKDQKLDERGYTHKPEAKNPLNSRCPTGFIALQDHGDKVRFRNIKIRDLSPDKDPGGFVPLFNGKDLAGWTAQGRAKWSVKDGMLTGRGALATDTRWNNFEVRAFVRADEGAKGALGLFQSTVREGGSTDWKVVRAAINNGDAKHFTGGLKTPSGNADPAHTPLARDGAWFDYRVRVAENRVQTWVNGVPMAMVNQPLLVNSQVHLVVDSGEILFKDVQARDLSGK